MKLERSVAVVLLTVLACTGGCASIETRLVSIFGSTPGRTAKAPNQEHDFATALEYLRKGNEQKARAALERVVEAPPLGGVTDEALFRLALLHLGDDGGRDTTESKSLLERLKDEYPKSLWTRQSAQLAAYLAGPGNLRDKEREIRTLRQLNLSLSRDNKELHQSIDKIKNLDIELEQKIRR